MTEAMPFLQKTILLSYDPRPFGGALFVFAPRRNGVASLLKKRYTELDL